MLRFYVFKFLKKEIFLIYLIFFIICIPIIFFRNLFSDELSYYLQASKLVKEGYLPYRDFFFPQMPFSAYAYFLTSIGGFEGVYLSRIFATILFFILSIIFYKNTSSLRLLLIFLFNGVFLVFYTIADKDIIISFFLSIIFFLSFKEKNNFNLFISGILLGILTGIRYIFFLSFLFFIPLKKNEMIILFSGFLIPFLLIIYFVSISPFYFFFDNFYYHLFLRQELQPSFPQKVIEIIQTILYPPNSIILFGLLKNPKKEFKKYYIFIIFINFLYYIILSGPQFFYLSHTLPLIIYLGKNFFIKMNKKIFKILFIIYFLSGTILNILFYLPGLKEPQKSFTRKNLTKICEIVEENMSGNDVIISELPHITYLLKIPSILKFRLNSSVHALSFDKHIYSPYHFYLYIKKYEPDIFIVHRENLKYTGIKDDYELLTEFSRYLVFKKNID